MAPGAMAAVFFLAFIVVVFVLVGIVDFFLLNSPYNTMKIAMSKNILIKNNF